VELVVGRSPQARQSVRRVMECGRELCCSATRVMECGRELPRSLTHVAGGSYEPRRTLNTESGPGTSTLESSKANVESPRSKRPLR